MSAILIALAPLALATAALREAPAAAPFMFEPTPAEPSAIMAVKLSTAQILPPGLKRAGRRVTKS